MSTLSTQLVNHPGLETVHDLQLFGKFGRGLSALFQLLGRSVFTWIIILPVLFLTGILFFVVYLLLAIKTVRDTHRLKAGTAQLTQRLSAIQQEIANGKSIRELGPFFDLPSYVHVKKTQEAWIQSKGRIRQLPDQLQMAAEELIDGDEEVRKAVNNPSHIANRIVNILIFFMKPFETYRFAYQKHLSCLQAFLKLQDASNPQGDYFSTLSEQELWEKRNKTYEYLL